MLKSLLVAFYPSPSLEESQLLGCFPRGNHRTTHGGRGRNPNLTLLLPPPPPQPDISLPSSQHEASCGWSQDRDQARDQPQSKGANEKNTFWQSPCEVSFGTASPGDTSAPTPHAASFLQRHLHRPRDREASSTLPRLAPLPVWPNHLWWCAKVWAGKQKII